MQSSGWWVFGQAGAVLRGGGVEVGGWVGAGHGLSILEGFLSRLLSCIATDDIWLSMLNNSLIKPFFLDFATSGLQHSCGMLPWKGLKRMLIC